MYHYTDSGLDNVYLANGFTIHRTPYGEGVSIENTEGLHRAIGLWLADLPKPLNGAEIRFLRLEMDLSQKHLGAVLGSTEQNVRRWEKNRSAPVPGMADRLLRVLYREYAGGAGPVRAIVERLAALDEVKQAQATLRADDGEWRVAA